MVLIGASKINLRHHKLDGWTLKYGSSCPHRESFKKQKLMSPQSNVDVTYCISSSILSISKSRQQKRKNFYFLFDLVNDTYHMGLALCLWSHSRVWPSSINYTSNSKTYNTNATFALRTYMHARTQRGTHRHLRPPISLSIRLALTLTGFREIAGLSCGRWGEQ